MGITLSSTSVAALGCCLAASLVAPAAAQERPPESEVIRRLANGGPAEWESGVVWSLAVPPEERSRELLTAMILALDRSLDWQVRRQRGWEIGGHLAQALAATRDPRIWGNIDSINPLLGAIALAGVVRTAELLARLEEIATTTFAEIEETSGSAFLAARAPACARAMLDRTEPPSPLCDPGWWVTPPGW